MTFNAGDVKREDKDLTIQHYFNRSTTLEYQGRKITLSTKGPYDDHDGEGVYYDTYAKEEIPVNQEGVYVMPGGRTNYVVPGDILCLDRIITHAIKGSPLASVLLPIVVSAHEGLVKVWAYERLHAALESMGDGEKFIPKEQVEKENVVEDSEPEYRDEEEE